MSKLFKVSIGIYVLVGVFFALSGLSYIITPEYMPYHAAATQTPWDQLDAGFKGLFLGLLKATGAGVLSMGITIILLALIPLRQKLSWAFWLVPLLAIGFWVLVIYATYTVYTMTPASPPIHIHLIACGFLIIACILSYVSRKSG